MDKIKIYLGDLTYDTVSLSTDSFPLSIGYVGAYCKKEFGTKVEVELFKFVWIQKYKPILSFFLLTL